jgi:two-component system cell cycle sensor histidine kinase/response regulator CckA
MKKKRSKGMSDKSKEKTKAGSKKTKVKSSSIKKKKTKKAVSPQKVKRRNIPARMSLKKSGSSRERPTQNRLVSEALKNALDCVGDAIVIQDLDYRVIYENEAQRNGYGVHSGELCYEAFENEKVICKNCPMILSFEDGGTHKVERRIDSDGSVQYFELTTSPLRDTSGTIIAGIKVIRDITGRKEWEESVLEVRDMLEALVQERTKELAREVKLHKKAEEERKRLSDNLQFIIRSSPLAMIAYDNDGRIVMWNPAAERLFGWTSDEVVGKPNQIMPDTKLDESISLIEKAVQGELIRGRELLRMKKDGSTVHVSLSTAPVKDADGKVISTIAIFEDITFRKQAQEIMMKSQFALEKIRDAVYWMGRDARFTYVNEAACNALGYTKDELLTMTAHDIGPEFPAEVWPEHWKDLKQRGSFLIQTVHQRKDGSVFPVEISVNFLTFGDLEFNCAFARDITDRKMAEDALRESEQFNREIISNMGEGFIVYDRTFRYLVWNKFMEELTGYPAEKVLGKNALDLFPHLRETGVDKLVERALAGEVAVSSDVRYEAPGTGKKGWVTGVYAPYFNTAGEIVGAIATISDITERKRATDELVKSRAEWANAMDYFEDALCIIDLDDKIVRANQAFYDLTGLTSDETVGHDVIPIMHPEGVQGECPLCTARREKRDAVVAMEPNHQHNPTGRPVEVMIKMIRDDAGKPVSSLMGIHDLSASRLIEEKLRESERRFRETLENANLIAIQLDQSGKIIFANDYFQLLTGREIFEILNKDWIDIFIPEENRDEIRELHRKNISDSMLVANYVNDIITRENERRTISWTNSHLRDSDGKVVGITSLGVDVTEQKRAEEERSSLEAQLRQSQKIEAVGRLAGGIAHDFNNILSAIIANSSLIDMNLKKDDKIREYVDQILSLSERATTLTKGLLAFSRKQIIDLKPIRINSVIENSEKILSRLIGEDIGLSVKLSKEDLTIMADNVQVEQVLMNLVTNARDAMPDGGVLTIRTGSMSMDREFIEHQGYGEQGWYALITITDTGIGMNEETKEKIFEPFFTSKDLGRGTGLGLSTIYGIVKQLNGYINVESELGRGTSFKIYFPLTDKKVTETKREEYTVSVESCTETILLAEDEEPVRNSLKAILETFGYTVIVAGDGEDAVDHFVKNKDSIDLLLFDVIMPNKSGKEAYDEIKNIKSDIKAIFLSGYTEDVIHKKGVLEDGLNFMYKPSTPGQLFREIKRVLKS